MGIIEEIKKELQVIIDVERRERWSLTEKVRFKGARIKEL